MLPIALTDAGWTAVAALGGAAIGAVVGSTSGGIVDWFLEVKRSKRLARAGARLVAGDIAMATSQVEVAQKEKKWWAYFEFRERNWQEYAPVLAAELDNDEFETVSQAVTVLREIFAKILAAPNWPPGAGVVDLTPRQVEGLGPIAEEAADAYNALAHLAGHERVGKRIHGAGGA